MDRFLWICALICFIADAVGVPVKVKLFSLGTAFAVATLLF
jgi:hypothetical protein